MILGAFDQVRIEIRRVARVVSVAVRVRSGNLQLTYIGWEFSKHIGGEAKLDGLQRVVVARHVACPGDLITRTGGQSRRQFRGYSAAKLIAFPILDRKIDYLLSAGETGCRRASSPD